MQTIGEAKAHCRFGDESGGVPALPPDFAKCGGSQRKNLVNNQGEPTMKKMVIMATVCLVAAMTFAAPCAAKAAERPAAMPAAK